MEKEIKIKLLHYLEKYNLSEFKEHMLNISSPVVNIIYDELNIKHEEEITIGKSKFGGLPHLPQNFKLPINEKFGSDPYADVPNKYYQFLFQINLEELNINSEILPAKGMLYFFYNFEYDLKIIYLEEISNLGLYTYPADYGEDYQKESQIEGVMQLSFIKGIHFDNSELSFKLTNTENEEIINSGKLMIREMSKDYFFTDFKIFIDKNIIKNESLSFLLIPNMDKFLDNYLLDWDCHGSSIVVKTTFEDIKSRKFNNIDIEEIQDEYVYDLLY